MGKIKEVIEAICDVKEIISSNDIKKKKILKYS